MQDKSIQIRGVIESVVYRNENNDYTVLEISDESSNLITAVGVMPLAFEGENVILYGSWGYHKEFGRQFVFDAYEKTLPKEIDGIVQYLSSKTVKGVGPITALKIVERFGTDTFDVIENHPEWLTDVQGITMKKAANISASFREQTGARELVMFCSDYMSTAEATKIYKKLGSGAVGLIKENPYILCGLDFGVPFEVADRIAESLGLSKTSDFRVLSGMEYILTYNSHTNGHTCLPYDKFVECSCELLGIEEGLICGMTDGFIAASVLKRYKIGDTVYIMSKRTYEAENYIARRLTEIASTATAFSTSDIAYAIEKCEISAGIEYADMQRRAVFEALLGGLLVITGGPGTGKTTIIKALCKIFDSLGLKVVLAAPTGRAAKRMSEATSHEAKTVHRLLETERTENGGSKFNRNERLPLDEKVVIIDEASMLDLVLTDALLRAIRNGTRLILIGDADQLPSVGAGNVFADIIASERVKTIKLTEIFRQSKESLIVTNAHKINAGEAPILNVTDNDFFLVRRDNEATIAESIASLVTERLPKAYGRGISEKIQVITPSKKGAGGVEELNRVLQERINPKTKFKREKLSHGITFREGDRVMQSVNNYDIVWERADSEGSGIFNGDIGIIEEINETKEYLKIRFDDRLAKYSYENLEELDLAYAITVHKSQGSEYGTVIIPMYYCAPMLMTRNLLYTAVTRAKNMLILVGRADIANKMVENNRHQMRYTTLKERICDYS